MAQSDLSCPFCRGALRDQHGLAGLGNDSAGPFAVCRRCGKRVKLEEVPTPEGSPAMFRVARKQEDA